MRRVTHRARLVTPQALLAVVLLDGVDELLVTPGEPEVLHGLLVHREEADGGAVLGRHVRDRRPVRDVNRAGAESLEANAGVAVLLPPGPG